MRRVFAALLCLALSGVAAAAGPVSLTAGQMRAFGSEALARGHADQALAIAEALLTRDANDSLALTLKAQALRMRGDLPGSEGAARAAWAAAGDKSARYSAATALAQALSLQNHRTTAQYWLRQAVQNAPNAGTRAQAVQDFNYVRDQNPLSLQFDGSLRPSNNVNGGARDPLFEYQGIPFILSGDALALSGLALGIGVSGTYRLSDSGAVRNNLTFAASQQLVILSDAARDQAPDARNTDYALGNIEAGWQRQATGRFGRLTTELKAGHTWYGGQDLSNSATARITFDRQLSPGVTGTLAASVTGQTRADRPVSDSTELGLEATLATTGPKGDHWQIGLNLSRITSDDISIDHREVALRLAWQAAAPVAGIGLGASVSLQMAGYDMSPYTANGRQDQRLGGSLTATLQRLSYLGFSPVLSLDVARNASNVALYDTETIGISVSVKSRF